MIGKKGNFDFITAGAISATAFFFILIIMVLIFSVIGGQSSINVVRGNTNTSASEQITILNNTAVPVTHALVINGSWLIYNGSNILGLGNFTLNNVSGTVTLKPTYTFAQAYNGSLVSVNYSYDNSGSVLSGDTNASSVVANAKTAEVNFSSLGTIFVYVIFLVGIIGMLAAIGYGAYAYMKR